MIPGYGIVLIVGFLEVLEVVEVIQEVRTLDFRLVIDFR